MRILLIEDEAEHARHFIAACGERLPTAEVAVASDGASGMAMVSKGPTPDVILLDLHLPGLNGFSVLETLRANADWRSVPVIVFTIDDSEPSRYACQRLGASYYQLKPKSRTGYKAFVTFLLTGWESGTFNTPG